MSYIWGESGIVAYARLESYKERLQENIDRLRDVKETLSAKTELLQSDPETLALSAREMGYYRESERVIYLPGYDAEQNLYVVGELMRPFVKERVNPLVFRIFAVVVGVVAYIVARYARWKTV
jgi:hypothetical protein